MIIRGTCDAQVVLELTIFVFHLLEFSMVLRDFITDYKDLQPIKINVSLAEAISVTNVSCA
jgi:hypothetical protein